MFASIKGVLIILIYLSLSRLLYADIDLPTMLQEAEICKIKNNMTQEEFEASMSLKLPSTTEGKCFLYCIMRVVAVLSEEGKFNVEGCKAILAESPVSDEDKQKLSEIPELCDGEVEIVENDTCETAYRLIKCLKKKGEEKGLVPPKF